MKRRTFIGTTASLGTVVLAGCSGDDPGGGGGGSDTGGGGGGGSGSFRLLISDQPAAIGDFDSLDVTLSSARVFRAGEDEEVTEAAVTATPEDDDSTEAEGDGEGYVEFQLDDVSVDLTQVVGDKAIAVLEGELDKGRYSGIELRVAQAEGVVDGEPVEVMVPNVRLRIINPFEVTAGADLSFGFDINVIQKGPNRGYNLLPVIGKSGVAGEDVEVEEVEDDGGATDEPTADGTETAEGTNAGGGQPTDAGNRIRGESALSQAR